MVDQASQWLGLASKALLVVIWLMILAAVALMAWDAAGSRDIVVDSFEVPPAMTKDGLTGETVANMMRDEFNSIRSANGAASANRVLETDWLKESRVKIPQAGVTVGEVAISLRHWLGDDTHVGGALKQEKVGFSLTVRAKGKTSTVAAPDLDRLTKVAAIAAYEIIDPYQHAVYLAGGSEEEQRESSRRLAILANSAKDPTERARALNALAVNILEIKGQCAEALPILEVAKSLDARLSEIFNSFSNAYNCLGQDQLGADTTARELRLLRTETGGLNRTQLARLRLRGEDLVAGYYGDYGKRIVLYRVMEKEGLGDQAIVRARALAELRDVGGSADVLHRYCAIARWGENPCVYRMTDKSGARRSKAGGQSIGAFASLRPGRSQDGTRRPNTWRPRTRCTDRILTRPPNWPPKRARFWPWRKPGRGRGRRQSRSPGCCRPIAICAPGRAPW
jgi:hypothetical protein